MIYEIVWTYQDSEYSLGTYDAFEDALCAFEKGPPRVRMLIHGGSLRIDEITFG